MSATFVGHRDPLLGFEDGFRRYPHQIRRRRRRVLTGLSVVVALIVLVMGGAAFKFVAMREKAQPVSLADVAARGQGGLDVKVAGGAAPGVYPARAEGRRTFSVGGIVAEDGPEVPVSVTHVDAGCWQVRVDYNSTVHGIDTHCLEGGRLVSGGAESEQRWDLGVAKVTISQERTCATPLVLDDAEATVGASWTVSCEIAMSGTLEGGGPTPPPPPPATVEVTHTLVGADTLTIDGQPVETRHYRQESAVAGAAEVSVLEVWFATDDRSLVKVTRQGTTELKADAGSATVTDEGTWTLASRRSAT